MAFFNNNSPPTRQFQHEKILLKKKLEEMLIEQITEFIYVSSLDFLVFCRYTKICSHFCFDFFNKELNEMHRGSLATCQTLR